MAGMREYGKQNGARQRFHDSRCSARVVNTSSEEVQQRNDPSHIGQRKASCVVHFARERQSEALRLRLISGILGSERVTPRVTRLRRYMVQKEHSKHSGMRPRKGRTRQDEDMTVWAKKTLTRICRQTPEDHDARRDFTKRCTDFLRHVVEIGEEKGTITFTYVCEHSNMFPWRIFFWRVSAKHGEQEKNNHVSDWWCGSCGMPC